MLTFAEENEVLRLVGMAMSEHPNDVNYEMWKNIADKMQHCINCANAL